MEKVLEDIRIERERQNKKWGVQNRNSVEWISILTEEVGEAAKEAVDFHFNNGTSDVHTPADHQTQEQRLNNLRKELIQVAAVAAQAVENIDRERSKSECVSDRKEIIFSPEMVDAMMNGRKTQFRRTIEFPVIDNENYAGGAFIEDVNKDRSAIGSDDLPSIYKKGDIFKATDNQEPPVKLFLEVTNVRVERLHDISTEDAKAEGIKYSISGAGFCGYDYIDGGYNLMTTARNSFFSLWRNRYGMGKWDQLPNPWVFVYTFKRI